MLSNALSRRALQSKLGAAEEPFNWKQVVASGVSAYASAETADFLKENRAFADFGNATATSLARGTVEASSGMSTAIARVVEWM